MTEDDDDPGWFATQFDDEQAEALVEAMGVAIAQASTNYGAVLRSQRSSSVSEVARRFAALVTIIGMRAFRPKGICGA